MNSPQERADRQKTYRVALIGGIVALPVFVWAIIETNRGVNANELRMAQHELQRVQEETRTGLHCVLLQLGEHRRNNYASDRAVAEQVGAAIRSPAPPPTDPFIDPAVCDVYFGEMNP